MNQKFLKVIKSYLPRISTSHTFFGGTTYFPVSGKMFYEEELINGVEAVLDGWWTEGRMK